MAESKENKDRIAFLKKKNEARKAASALDWSKDKNFSYGNKPGFKYVSVEKMKRNLLPVFLDAGLDFKFDYQNLQKSESIGSMSQHWILECTATLTDIDTGYSETATVFGEAGDSGDKAIGKASTYALKTWLSDTFMLIDGIDPEAEPEMVSSRVFIPKTDKEQEEVKSKAFANAVPPTPVQEPVKPAAPAKPAVKNVPGTMKDSGDPTKPAEPVKPAAPKPKTSGKKVEIPPVPKPELPKKPLKPAEASIEKLKLEAINNYVPTAPQQNAFDRIFEYFGALGQKGEITPEFAAQLAKDRSEIKNATEAIAFIRKYEIPDDAATE